MSISQSKKKVAYLLGSGATHGVLNSVFSEKGLLTANIRDKISTDYEERNLIDDKILNELISEKVDIEHLISVVETQYNYSAVQKLRKLYSKAIIDLSSDLINNFCENLYTYLIDLHNIEELNEEIICFLTLNYEDILERTIKKHFNADVDYLIYNNENNNIESMDEKKTYQVLKLHGSFNWINERPIKISYEIPIPEDKELWIPPGVEKRKENYPFNFLWGRAKELLLRIDILRIVGCSLSRNDWGLIPLLYTVQRFHSLNKKLTIEIIDYPKTMDGIEANYPYLIIERLENIKEFRNFFSKQFSLDTGKNIVEEMKSNLTSDKVNIFQMWLEAKAENLLDQGHSLNTANNYFHKFYYKL